MNKAVLYILLSSICFAVVNVGVKGLSNEDFFGWQKLPAHELVFFRSLITFIISYFILKKQGHPIFGNNKKWLLIRGVFGTTALTLFFFTIQNTDLAIATVLQYLSPVFTILFAMYFFKEKVTLAQWFFIAIAFSGVATLGIAKLNTPDNEWWWVMAGLISAIFSGVSYNAIMKCRKTDSAVNVVIYFPMIATPIMFIWCLFDFVLPIGIEWVVILIVGVMTQFAQIFMTKALHAGDSNEIMPFKYIGAIYAVMIGYFVFDETLNLISYIAMVLILLGVIGNQLYKSWLKQKNKRLA